MNSVYRLVMLVVMAVSFAAPALAEEKTDLPREEKAESGWKIRSRVWWQVGAVPLYFLGHNVVHEGGHSLAAVAAGGRVTDFAPYPHTLDWGKGQKGFVFASMAYTGQMSKNQENWILAAPSIADLTLFTAADLTLSYTDPDGWYGPVLFMAGMVCPLIDWLVAMNAPSAHSDISRLAANNGWNRIGVAVVGDAIAVVAIWRVLRHGRRLFIAEKPVDASKPTISVNPLMGSGLTGFSLAGTF